MVSEKFLQRNIRQIDLFLFLAALIHVILTFFVGFQNPITDIHGFRQTQTAITVYYFLKEGFSISYITPILGEPWTIPFELPIYQYVVATVVYFTKMNIDAAGRLVSIFCFYGILAFVVKLRHLIQDFPWKIALIFILVNPIYIFWSRAFLIESMALLFGVWYIFFSLKFFQNSSNQALHLFLVLFLGLAGVMLKVTTFLICVGLAGMFLLQFIVTNKSQVKSWMVLAVGWSITVGIHLAAINYWTKFSDVQKSKSYLGSQQTSTKLSEWNFGNLVQRFSWINEEHLTNPFFGAFVLVVLGGLIILVKDKPKLDVLFWVFLMASLLGPMLFFNLYLMHNYYFYANGLFLLLALAYFVQGLRNARLANGFFYGLVAFSYSIYFFIYFPAQRNSNFVPVKIANIVKQQTKPEDIIMLLGDDWSSEIPYYSERKMIAVPHWMMKELKNDPKDFIKKLNYPNVQHLLLTYQNKDDFNAAYVHDLAKQFGLTQIKHFKNQDIHLLTR